MSHEITRRANGKNEIAFVGEVPWHGLGQSLQVGAPIEQWVEAAGMDWQVRRSDIMYYADRAQTDLRTVEDSKILTRSDTGMKLGIVSPKYQIVQPREILEFFRDLVGNAGFELHTAGTLFGGSRYWALAQVADGTISGWDKIGGFMLLSTSADGSRATEIRETTVRVVCNNTLSMAFEDRSKNVIKISHRETFNADRIKAEMGLSVEHFDNFLETANTLSKVRVSTAAAESFITNILRQASNGGKEIPDDADVDNVAEDARAPRGMELILGLFEGGGRGALQKGAAGTAWGLVNAVTEYVDHLATAKTIDNRFDRAMWGSGNDLKTLTLRRAMGVFA